MKTKQLESILETVKVIGEEVMIAPGVFLLSGSTLINESKDWDEDDTALDNITLNKNDLYLITNDGKIQKIKEEEILEWIE